MGEGSPPQTKTVVEESGPQGNREEEPFCLVKNPGTSKDLETQSGGTKKGINPQGNAILYIERRDAWKVSTEKKPN